MRHPVRRDELYKTLKQELSRGVFAVGAFLPCEVEMAKRYGVSRDTMRAVLSLLEDDKLIERIERKGTLVCLPPKPLASPSITFLLPCSDFIIQAGYRSVAGIREMMCGAISAAGETNCRVETVAVSPTNRNDDIDWGKLEHLNSGSKVILSGWWYHTIFSFLHKRGCRVALINIGMNPVKDKYREILGNWLLSHDNGANTFEKGVDYLAAKGCRRIAMAIPDLTNKHYHSPAGYFRGVKKIGGMPRSGIVLDITDIYIDNKGLPQALREFESEHHFDGLLINIPPNLNVDYRLTLNKNLLLSEKVRILTLFPEEYNSKIIPQTPTLHYPYQQMGYDAAIRLTQAEFTPGHAGYDGSVMEFSANANSTTWSPQ